LPAGGRIGPGKDSALTLPQVRSHTNAVGFTIVRFGRFAAGGRLYVEVCPAPGFAAIGLLSVPGPLDGRAALAHGIGVFLAGERFRPLLGAGVVLAGLLGDSVLGAPIAVLAGGGGASVVDVAGTGDAINAHRHAPAAGGLGPSGSPGRR